MFRSAAMAATRAPTRPDPVKLIADTSGARRSASPTAGPEPGTRLNTPAGSDTDAVSASSDATCDDISAGLSTTVFPNASAGAVFHSGIATGKFHGVISATTPNGSRLSLIHISEPT